LAAVAATGAAFAQSSVTLYGVADIGLAKTNKAGLGYGNDSLQATANGTLNNGNSRLGVRGVEDLGGGLKASFNFEQGVNLANGATDSVTWQRAAFAALSGGFGEIYAGRRLSPSFYGVAAWELTGTANYSATAAQFAFAGAGSRNNAHIGYTTPSFGGLTATLGTTLKGNDASAADGLQSKIDMNVIYKGGPISAGLSYNKVQDTEKNWSIGASYNLGVATVAASYQDPAGDKKGFTIGASAPLGPVTLTFDIARVTSGVKETDYVLEAKYAVSKRTFAYAALLRDGLTKTNGLGVGLRHNF
ncbi:MAG TPA: porin, partial [Burkholderiaceae bacterium]|nr:porin [Burkholderiaceae bacterium]